MKNMPMFHQITRQHSPQEAAIAASLPGETVIIELPQDYAEYHQGELDILLPMLSHLMQNENRWLAWIAPPCRITSDRLANHGISPTSLLQIYPGHASQHFRLVKQALATGRCGIVMAWTHQCSPEEIEQLRDAAALGKALCILFVHTTDTSRHDIEFSLGLRRDTTSNDLWFELLAPTPLARLLTIRTTDTGQAPCRSMSTEPVQLSIF